MTTVTTSSPNKGKTADYAEGQFDAALSLPAKTQHGDYWKGYLAKTNETGNTPF